MYKIGNNIILEISKDKQNAYITILESGDVENEVSNYEVIVSEVKEHVKYGFDESQLRMTLDDKIIGKKVCIAKGKLPVPGMDGSIKYHFEMEKPLLPKLKKDGTVDYRELDSINTVNIGDVLAEIIPPTEGEEGISVSGDIIPFIKGKTPKFRYGNNITLSLNGLLLKSAINGLVEFKGGKINVSEVLMVENIDNSIGNINFVGNVIVNGDILNGFSLVSGSSVEVKGAVEGGYIECEGDVLIRQGIQGYNRLSINTKGNLSTKFIENADVNVGENITSEAIMHSNVSSKSNILVLGKKGLIVGGVCRSKYEIRAKMIGSTMATTTILEVGIDPDIKLSHDDLESKLKLSKQNLDKINQSLKVLEVLKKSDKLDSRKLELYNNLLKASFTLGNDIIGLEADMNNINKQMENLSRGQIKVADTIYPGVKIIIGNSFMYIRDEMKRCTFYREDGEIRIGPY